jgi:hypothetical protein
VNASVRRVVAAYRRRQADQSSKGRQQAQRNAQPINKPRGIDREITKENGEQKTKGENVAKPQKRDILPKDVFTPTPDNVGVLNLAQTGKDLSKAIPQIKKDKGHDVVYNLSQYLIRTKGNGEEGTEEGKK